MYLVVVFLKAMELILKGVCHILDVTSKLRDKLGLFLPLCGMAGLFLPQLALHGVLGLLALLEELVMAGG